ncbi:alpha-hydroxy acid oxidase [Granulosicoccus antarcticus]|uniref:4-hydroxymandelate oxidase n=1 Tax=Granulosicoccus antarcticus IMCC3135 TaxID=1192854 RepID=A0A2Z2NZ64_9GAMM|nr:alpha-hydroxy acid oxidase [Granulosicoccus antarcticus]ASJ75211.1 4-hydroxymandelate oxidase [Granulosicoccus antarcticus IMCC3135]
MRMNPDSPMKSGSVIPPGTVCLEDYERLAREVLPHDVYEYLASGCADDLTLASNRSSFDRWQILPRMLTDCTQGSTELTLLGEKFRHPILLAPVAHQGLVHPDAELATAEAAAIMEAGMIASTLSSVPMEGIANQLQSNKWFQLYFQKDRNGTLDLIRRAEVCGFSALIVTVDVPVNGVRNRVQRSGFRLPEEGSAANLSNQSAPEPIVLEPHESIIFQGLMREAPTWQDIEWLKSQTDMPILLKGILHPADAVRCQELGLQGIVVSNHGGRSLDTVPSTMAMLPLVREAVGKEFPVLLDGGIRRGADVFKALALGADAVLIGRPQVFALAVAGALGVAHMLKLLRDELEITMALAGCPSLARIGREALFDATSYSNELSMRKV